MTSDDEACNFDAVAFTEMEYVYDGIPLAQPSNGEPVGTPDTVEPELSPSQTFRNLRNSDIGAREVALDDSLPQLHGLSLSGGGIRSAAFCLGVVEALAELGLLNQFHYVSSVSGGGYTASWLAAWSYREPDGIAGVQRTLRAAPSNLVPPIEVQHISRYATYLAPRAGALSPDMWSLLSTYFRNLTITLGTTLPFVVILASLPILIALLSTEATKDPTASTIAGLISAAAMILFSFGSRQLACASDLVNAKKNAGRARVLAILGPGIGGLSLAYALGKGAFPLCLELVSENTRPQFLWMTVFLASIIVVAYIGYKAFQGYRENIDGVRAYSRIKIAISNIDIRLWHCIGYALVVVLSCGLLWALDVAFSASMSLISSLAPLTKSLLSISIAPLLWCLCYFLGETLLQAVLSARLSDGDREWMARFGGLALTAAIAWFVFCITVVGIPKMAADTSIVGAWLIFAFALVAAKIFMRVQFRDIAIALAAAFSLSAIGLGLFLVVEYWLSPSNRYLRTSGNLVLSDSILFVTALILDVLVSINRFSMHALYRDRLVRTFLGASRTKKREVGDSTVPEGQEGQFSERQGSPFHDFDADDNPKLSWLKSDRGWRPNHWMPVFLFNASLNRTWREEEPGRMAKAFSFSFSAFFCGSKFTSYCPTEEYLSRDGGLSLGAAMATSGAALSSRSGRYDNRLLSFFLTLLNLRLGTWMGNPNSRTARKRAGPPYSTLAYFSELFGASSSRSDWIHLSDGGHFENLGVFELIRRGCRKIIAIDSSADPARHFSDLSNLIRLARDELNVSIEPMTNMSIGDRVLSDGRYATIFFVNYPEGASGRLIYIKPSFYEKTSFNVPIEVQSYAKAWKAFPHESTTDQFFSAEQFDAYRRLGQHEMRTIAGPKKPAYHLRDLFDLAAEHTVLKHTPSPAPDAAVGAAAEPPAVRA